MKNLLMSALFFFLFFYSCSGKKDLLCEMDDLHGAVGGLYGKVAKLEEKIDDLERKIRQL